MTDTNPLDSFRGLAACPVCGCLERRGMYRCPECGTFHAGSIMEEREAPPVQMQVEVDEKTIDPSVYSLGPNATIPEESFDESDDVRSWDGGSTDFSFDEDEELEMSSKSSEALPVDVLLDEDE